VTTGKISSFGPAILVTAAFIGPGTVMMASKAGSEFGCVLLWAVLFSVLTTIVLQEMAARLGIVTGEGLCQSLKNSISNPIARWAVLGLILTAILVGNAAYQTGNILGAAGGVQSLVSTGDQSANKQPELINEPQNVESSNLQSRLGWAESAGFRTGVVVVIGMIALAVIWIGRFEVFQVLLTLLVVGMSLMFVYAAFQSSPDWTEIASGFIPRIPTGSELVIIGLVGTTVVPYNLFLHASAAAQWSRATSDESAVDNSARIKDAIFRSRVDTVVSVMIGGLVTAAILVTASAAFHSIDGAQKPSLGTVQDVALQLEPSLGSGAKVIFAIGLFAAGLTSAITAPIAAAFAASGCFGWSGKLKDKRLKVTASMVVLCGVVFACLFGKSPKETIILAQVANGLLLPVVAVGLLIIVNRTELMGSHKNGKLANLISVVVLLVVVAIALTNLNSVVRKIYKQYVAPPSNESVERELPTIDPATVQVGDGKSS